MQPQELTNADELEAIGKVVMADESFIWVKTQRQSGCSGCQSEKGCGTSTLAKLFAPESSSPLKILNTLNAKEGQQVMLSLNEADLIKHSFMAYGLPLLGLFVGAFALQLVLKDAVSSDWPAILGGFLGLFAGWGVTRWIYKPVQPTLKSIIS
ncbi:SoxR reducing system RseC family protein [Thiosulfativibrio zosterae]|uniref:Sigma E factor positive regulatory protein RseC n=1 Tax=Thiosulfativibrio zosterae TaxID=2675053 RepID=A0A6F8PNA2_9GAMM|nr:SoxR reducing system RseC family protein [Thiosulfativibrio zosterae]BBP43470.1 sigma E factor positive regulatory protein RseC [Thiosulfativibrio zosterae]